MRLALLSCNLKEGTRIVFASSYFLKGPLFSEKAFHFHRVLTTDDQSVMRETFFSSLLKKTKKLYCSIHVCRMHVL